MSDKRTDRELLRKGIKIMLLTVVLMFAGPTLLYIALANKEANIFYPTLILGGLLCIGAILMAFKGLQTIMKSLFD